MSPDVFIIRERLWTMEAQFALEKTSPGNSLRFPIYSVLGEAVSAAVATKFRAVA
jgi:hypothetical protein